MDCENSEPEAPGDVSASDPEVNDEEADESVELN